MRMIFMTRVTLSHESPDFLIDWLSSIFVVHWDISVVKYYIFQAHYSCNMALMSGYIFVLSIYKN